MSSSLDEQTTIYRALAVSLVLHLLFLLTLSFQRPPLSSPPRTIEVSLEASPQQRQIVSTTPSDPVPAPIDTNKLSDRDRSVLKEQVKRGDAQRMPSQQPQKSKQAIAKQPSSLNKQVDQEKPQKAANEIPKKLLLKINPDGILEAPPKKPLKSQKVQEVAPFSRPAGSGAQFIGSSGTRDYLPNLPDGDLTLLNAKAEQYATFVRRVAEQVFNQLRNTGWERLSAAEIQRLSTFTTVRAWMSKEGKLIKVLLEGSSGSGNFDQTLIDAAKAGTRDSHPPLTAALEDGTIQFIFKARSWVRSGYNPRTKSPREERWLLLATGLE